ncbi:putative immunoglobulin-blocking virulence protein [Mycoplasmopsis cynos]|uniref:putative immunoglobulin-blocking virulence protein n=1 Tax=Mycoplasmopsis cynos TaxID=171284 RepID=UPI002AFEA0CC|nr:putative immunoglobulin-blocking virulence protein [Mycoplasmopsis cynos]WQQ18976.1 putative immunoglobulin-blocking virulence protein [Mycoplasmopsis cynos]
MLKRRKKVFLLAGIGGMIASIALTTVYAQLSKNISDFKFNISGTVKTFIDNETADPSNARSGAYDDNLPRRKIKEPIKDKIPTPNETIDNTDKLRKIEKPKVEPDVKPNPPESTPETQNIPRVKKHVLIEHGDISYYGDKVYFKPREYSKADIAKGIANRIPYRAELLPDVENITGALTEKNIEKSVQRAIRHGKAGDYIFGKGSQYRELLEDKNKSIDEKVAYYNSDGNAPEQLSTLWFKYYRLLKSKETIAKYVDDIALQHLDEWWNSKEEFSWLPPRAYERKKIPLGHLQLLLHIDHSKITNISQSVKDELAKGYVIPQDSGNVWVNDKGEWESGNYEPPLNPVDGEIRRNNRIKRVLGNNSIWSRNPEDVERGKYGNWRDTDVTEFYRQLLNKDSEFKDLIKYRGIGGFSITQYDRIEEVKGADRKKAVVVTIDLEYAHAFEKAEKLIEAFKKKQIDITGYRIKNVGKNSSDQDISKILAVLPQKLPLLELFFESKNTSALKYIKDKEIDELSLLSNNKVNTLDDDWALNPWALNKVAWVNMADYNVSGEYIQGLTIYSRITFDNLAFDDEDYRNNDPTIINNGLRMAYWTRNNERIFQGPFGPGNKPDRDSDGNSYPMGIDLSRVKNIKTLRGLIFYDEERGKQFVRKLNKIKLYNDSDTWEVPVLDMNEAQFDDILIKQKRNPRSKIMFSNGNTTKKIKITIDNSNTNLNSKGLQNLSTLIEYSDGNFNNNTEIIVPSNARELLNTLKGAGYNARIESEDDGLEFV